MPGPNAGHMTGQADKGARKAQDPFKERVVPVQDRLPSPESLWSESDEVSDEDIPPGNLQSLVKTPAQVFGPQPYCAGSLFVTPSPKTSPSIMDSVAQLIGYPDSDVEDESEREVEPQRSSTYGGEAHTFISPFASRLQTPEVPYKDPVSRKATAKIDRSATGVQKTLHSKSSVPFKAMATPNSKKRGPIYQSSSESDDDGDGNGRDGKSFRGSSPPVSSRPSSQAASYSRPETPRQEFPRVSSQPSLGKINRARINKVIAQSKLDKRTSRRSTTPANSATSSGFKSPPSVASSYKQGSVKDSRTGFSSGITNYTASSRAPTPQPYNKGASTAKKPALLISFNQKDVKPSPYIAEPVKFGVASSRRLVSPSPVVQSPISASPRTGPGSSAFTSRRLTSSSPILQGPGQTGSPPTLLKPGPPPPPTYTIFGTTLKPTIKHPEPVPHLTTRAISPKDSKVNRMTAPKKQTAHPAAKAVRSPVSPEESKVYSMTAPKKKSTYRVTKATRSPALLRSEPSSISPKDTKVASMSAPKRTTAHPATKTAGSPTPAHSESSSASSKDSKVNITTVPKKTLAHTAPKAVRAPTPGPLSKMGAAAVAIFGAHATAATLSAHATATPSSVHGTSATTTNAAHARKTGGISSSARETPATQPTLGPFFSMWNEIHTDYDIYGKANEGAVAGGVDGAKGGLKNSKSAEADAREKKIGAVGGKETPRPGSPNDREKKKVSSSYGGKMTSSSPIGKDVVKAKPAASMASTPRPGSPDKDKKEASPPYGGTTASTLPPDQGIAKPKPAVPTGTTTRPSQTPSSSLLTKDTLPSQVAGKEPKVDGKASTPHPPVVPKTAPTDPRKENPKPGRYTPRVHIRTPSGPTDFDIFIPPTPGMMDVPSASRAAMATSGGPWVKDPVAVSPPVLEKKGLGNGDATTKVASSVSASSKGGSFGGGDVSRVDVKEGSGDGEIVEVRDGDVDDMKKDKNGGVEEREGKVSVEKKEETEDEKRDEDEGGEVHEGITIMTAMSTDPDVATNAEPSELKQDSEPFLESYFEYRIKQRLWPASDSEEDAVATTVGNTTTLIDTANREAEEFFTQVKEQYLSAFAVQHEQSSTSYNEGGCLELKCTLSSVGWPDKQVLLKVWVHRSTVPSAVVAFHQPPEHTPFISKTLYILRLNKITKVSSSDQTRSCAETQDEVEDEADRSNEASTSDSGENSAPDSGSVPVPDDDKDDKKRKTDELVGARSAKRRKTASDSAEVAKGQGCGFVREYHEIPWPEVYTTIAGANSAACNLHISMMQETVPLRKEQRMEANARLKGKLGELDGKRGKDSYWRSEIPIGFSGSSKFELVVDQVGVCGPRNV